MIWGVVDLQALQQAPGLGRIECFVESSRGVSVEIVHYQHDLLGVGVMDIDQLLYALSPVELRSPIGDLEVAPTCKGLANDEEVGRPVALVFVVVTGCPSWLGGERLLTSPTSCLFFSSRHTCGRLGS